MLSNKTGKKELLVLTIDLGAKKDEIHVYDTDTPHNLAQVFCKHHNLDLNAEDSISQYISLNLSKLASPIKPKIPQNFIETIPEIVSQAKRLIQERSKDINSKSITKTPSKKTHGKSLPGERLYYQGIVEKKIKEENVSKIIAEREAEEINQATFRPKINRNYSSRGIDDKRLGEKEIKGKIIIKRINIVEEIMKNCTFKPSVNKMSLLMDKARIKEKNLHLYLNFRRRTEESPPRTTDRKRQGKNV
ncbi:hypothetical protein SteCoe_23021 [Stentor coeruleus]|uniref:PFU domain-containing protein n=1 Tax=Stentor coeruleus TaxID=5963 RepID=A0A1R2BKS9_9CILI|nr:hypothetical protein SteCoe_23021 [Stentor coeruleus]